MGLPSAPVAGGAGVGCVLVVFLLALSCCLLLTTLSTTLQASIFDVVEWN